jgi:hypothetical protein
MHCAYSSIQYIECLFSKIRVSHVKAKLTSEPEIVADASHNLVLKTLQNHSSVYTMHNLARNILTRSVIEVKGLRLKLNKFHVTL